jgi:cell wall assembly regulator SMI1
MGHTAGMREVIKRLADQLTALIPGLAPAPGADAAALEALAANVGRSLPAGFRALYQWSNGGDGLRMRDMSLMPIEDILRTRQKMNDQLAAGSFGSPNWWHKGWVPFLHDGAGSYLCWDTQGSFDGERGQVLAFWNEDKDRTIMAPSFDTWLVAFVDSLEAKVWVFDPASGHLDDEGPGGTWKSFVGKRHAGYPWDAITGAGQRKPRPASVRGATTFVQGKGDARAYRASERFAVGDRLSHPTFGEGVVQAVAAADKITVRFGGGPRVLVHGKS